MRQKKPAYEPLGIWDPQLRQDYSGYLKTLGVPVPTQPAPKQKKPGKRTRGKQQS